MPTKLEGSSSLRETPNIYVRAVVEIILRVRGPQALFCPVGGGCFVDNMSEGWGGGNLAWGGQGVLDP